MEIFFLLIVLFIYFIPSFMGYKKEDSTAIILMNLLLGWTFIGWVIALVWAATPDKPKMRFTTTPPGHISDLERLTKLKNEGALTEAEFETQKKNILNKL